MRLSAILNRLTTWTGIDRAISFSLGGRVWAMCSGAVTVALVARFLTRAQQGYYYTFFSLAAVQIIFELGFSFVILQLAAHERVSLRETEDRSFEPGSVAYARLASVLQQAVRWYTIAALIMGISLLIVGFLFFSREHPTGAVHWKLPWACVVASSLFTFQIDPVISFLEGCGNVVAVGRLRMRQAILGSLLAWTAVLSGHGLFAPGLLVCGQACMGLAFLYSYRKLLLPLLRLSPIEHVVSWSKEIWPFQWRIAISWASAYCILQLMGPIIFMERGPVAAGRVGMSISLCNSLGNAALSWVTTKAAPFGALVARRAFAELDQIFFRTLWQSLSLLAMSSLGLLGVLRIIIHFYPLLGMRILPLPLFAILLLTMALTHVTVSQAYYLRAHKREPFLYFWIFIAIIAVASMWEFAHRWGVLGIVIAYLISAGVLRACAATWVFATKRRAWHSTPSPCLEITAP